MIMIGFWGLFRIKWKCNINIFELINIFIYLFFKIVQFIKMEEKYIEDKVFNYFYDFY